MTKPEDREAPPPDRRAVEAAVASLQEHLAGGDQTDATLRIHCEAVLLALCDTYRSHPAAFSSEAIDALREIRKLLSEAGSAAQAGTPDKVGGEVSQFQGGLSKMTEDPKPSDEPDQEPPKRLSQKEFAREMRHEAYLRAREYRKTDPRQIAMKEKLKQQRRDAYQKVKERGKVIRAERKK